MEKDVVSLIFNYGFPAGVAVYLLFLIDKRLLEWSSIVTKQITSLYDRDKNFDEKIHRLERKVDDILKTLNLTRRGDDPR
jgi:hypothetical protein